jgi:hypothetical protein
MMMNQNRRVMRNAIPFLLAVSLLMLPGLNRLSGQVEAGSETMKRMLADARLNGLQIERSGTQDLDALCPGKQMRVEVTGFTLTELGVKLFHETMDRSDAPPVYDFVERYMLALILKRDRAEQSRRLRADSVTLKVNGGDFAGSGRSVADIVCSIETTSPFRLSGDDARLQAQWQTAAGHIELSFPRQYDLILGRDKKELADAFRTELETFVCPDVPALSYTPLPNQYLPDLDIYADLGPTLLIPQIRSGRYFQYQPQGGQFVWLFNERMATESLLNLFGNADEMKRKNRLQATVKSYRLSEEFPFSIDRLCAYMKARKCTAYMGIETKTETELTGTVMYVNRDLMYLHLLHFKFPKEAFGKESVPVPVTLYPYIPIHNVASLYDDIKEHIE